MKLFIKNIRLFFMPLIIMTPLVVVLLITNYFIIQSHPLKIPAHKKTLILGDSNTACAINDSIYNKAYNLSEPGSPYFYSYLRLKKALQTNTQIDTILVSFAPHNIINNDMLLKPSHIQSQIGPYYSLMNIEEFVFLYKPNPEAIIKSLTSLIREAGINCFNKASDIEIKYPGGFYPLEKTNLVAELNQLFKNKKGISLKKTKKTKYSQHEIIYLKKIIALCKQHQIKIYLINTPKRIEFIQIPDYGIADLNLYYSKYFADIPYLDYSMMRLPDDCYSDLIHLNKKGADFFSKKLKIKSTLDTSP